MRTLTRTSWKGQRGVPVDLDLVRARDAGLGATPDPTILEWAAARRRVLLTHDRRTIPFFAYARVAAGQPMPGIFLVADDMPIGQAMRSWSRSIAFGEECRDIVKYFPM